MEPSAIAEASAGVALLGAVAWDEMPAADLPGVMVELERMRARLDAARIEVAGLLEHSGAAGDVGWASTKDFLTAVSGGRHGAGGGLLRLAAGLEGLPEVRAALAAGWLSSDKARVIANRVAQLPRVEEVRVAAARSLLERARELDATDLDRAWHEVIAEIDPDGRLLGIERDLPQSERAARNARFLGFTADEMGGVWIKGYADAESVEEVKAALLPLAAPVSTEPGACGGELGDLGAGRRGTPCPDPGCAHDGRDPREAGARMWDALVELCRRAQAAEVLPETHGVRPRLTVSVALEDLRAELGRAGKLPGDQALSATAVRRLACDADIIPLVPAPRARCSTWGAPSGW